MNNYYTVMIIPEKEKGVKTFKIPALFFRSLAFFAVMLMLLLGILAFDYWKILQQVYENKHLGLENRQLKEQVQLFQMKMNALADDLRRINTFERKLRVITGLEDATEQGNLLNWSTEPEKTDKSVDPSQTMNQSLEESLNFDEIESTPEYTSLKSAYDQKIATTLGLEKSYNITKRWSELARRSFGLSSDYARFDFQYARIKKVVANLEGHIHELDQHLLDKESYLSSTPTLLPAQGWITSYFGQRISPTAGKLKMHEGIDVGAPYGTQVHAPADGIVTYSGEKAGFGKFVQVDHGFGIETIYAHNQSLFVRNGQKIKRGHLLAGVGNTGHSTGPHLHYEVRVNGIAVDPLYFILE
ncbi:MAG: M23 family metallopeptidase [Bacteriovoracaceae bacterium]|nr:M23 family metallopeptidase [Bacteriovoracaceae bacterium]